MFSVNHMCRLVLLLISLLYASVVQADATHPRLVHTVKSVAEMSVHYQKYPLFLREVEAQRQKLDAQLQREIIVPLPKDAGGGYTHEQHKKNYSAIYNAGLLFNITGEQVYANFARDILLAYADLYPTLGTHPLPKKGSPGKLFWQSLNEAVWLVHSIQGYDLIYQSLTPAERQKIESGVLIPVAKFLSKGQPAIFNKVHNHGTWAVAAVGMTGYVLNQSELVEQALYGLDKSGEGGFVKQLDVLFSPDGYYNEGPYYQRYALMPFVLFAKAIQNNEPERKIFVRRDGILLKAIYATIQLSYNGKFFPINDAIKDKGIDTVELLHGVAIAYGITADASLLSVAEEQGALSISGDAMAMARAIENNEAEPFEYRSMQFSDGTNGYRGALAVMRSDHSPGHMAVVMKNTSQGLGHGHFDKLNWLLFDNGHEIVFDYGAARFLNIEPKGGGHYLAENKSWAKQTIAHNTLVVDESSHFSADAKLAEKHWPTKLKFAEGEKFQLASASMQGAYRGVDFSRALAMLTHETLEYPIIIDVLRAQSESNHQYDLPLHYKGHLINWNLQVDTATEKLEVLGDKNGYEHLWVNATGKTSDASKPAQITWLNNDRFYSLSAAASEDQQFLFTTLGANDAEFNLLQENAIIRRVVSAEDQTFVSLIEAHGEYNGTQEFTREPYSQITELDVYSEEDIEFIYFVTKQGKAFALALAFGASDSTHSQVRYLDKAYAWHGMFKFFEL